LTITLSNVTVTCNNALTGFAMKEILTAIESGIAIRFNSLLIECDKLGISLPTIRKIFSIESAYPKGKGSYLLTIKDEDKYRDNFQRFFERSNDVKVQAALHGNSKRAKSNHGLLNVKEDVFADNATSIIFTNRDYNYKTEKRKCLLVENFNTFCGITDCFSEEALSEYLIVYSKGNEITSLLYADFLSSFDEVLCFFDFDLGGLRFIKGLSRTINKLKVHIPPDIDNYMITFGKPLTDSQYTEIVSKYAYNKDLRPMVNVLLRHKKILEQEVLQHNMGE
jgi:hypothetical protein